MDWECGLDAGKHNKVEWWSEYTDGDAEDRDGVNVFLAIEALWQQWEIGCTALPHHWRGWLRYKEKLRLGPLARSSERVQLAI